MYVVCVCLCVCVRVRNACVHVHLFMVVSNRNYLKFTPDDLPSTLILVSLVATHQGDSLERVHCASTSSPSCEDSQEASRPYRRVSSAP